MTEEGGAHMVGMFVETLPVVASSVVGILILVMLGATVVYGWLDDEASRRTAAGQPLKKAA